MTSNVMLMRLLKSARESLGGGQVAQGCFGQGKDAEPAMSQVRHFLGTDLLPVTKSEIVGVLRSPHVSVEIAGHYVTGTHKQVKRALLSYGTPRSIEAASKLRSPIVKVKAGSKTFNGDVNEVGKQVKGLIERWQIFQYAVDPESLYGGTTLPVEAINLTDQEPLFSSCPVCHGEIKVGKIFEPGTPFMRGMVQRSRRPWYAPWRTRPYCAVICPHCKEIVGWEEPGGAFEVKKGPYR